MTKLALLVISSALLLLPGSSPFLAAIVAATLWGALRLRARGQSRARADQTRITVVEAADALASELRAGLAPVVALDHVARTWEEFVPIAAAARIDADVADAFRRAGAKPGAEALAEVGAAWQVTQQAGAGLAAALDRVVSRSREDLEVHRVVSGELASARATARMLAVLPIGVLGLTGSAGPWRFLLGTPPGLVCLALGTTFAFAGMWWIESIVARVARGIA